MNTTIATIIIAAIAAAIVVRVAIEISLRLPSNQETSPVHQGANRTATFTGIVMSVTKEVSSTRGIVTLHTGTDRVRSGVPAGCEQVRTDRTDHPYGLMIAKQVKGLIGHRVSVTVEVQNVDGGPMKIRVLTKVNDLGPAPEFETLQVA